MSALLIFITNFVFNVKTHVMKTTKFDSHRQTITIPQFVVGAISKILRRNFEKSKQKRVYIRIWKRKFSRENTIITHIMKNYTN